MENLKVGFIGLGQRGSGLLGLVAKRFRDVDIVAVCDVYEDRVQAAIEKNFQRSGNTAVGYNNHKDLLADENVQIVIISASWEDHIPLAIESMRAGKVTALEVGGAYSVDKVRRQLWGDGWWEDEQPSEEIKQFVEQQVRVKAFDVILSHTCPLKYVPIEMFLPGIDQRKVDSSTEEWLDIIEEMADYKAWYCGHWHVDKRVDRMHFLFRELSI